MKMRGSVPDRVPKMSVEEFRARKLKFRQQREAAAKDADERNRELAGMQSGVEAGIVLGAQLTVADEVPQSAGDE